MNKLLTAMCGLVLFILAFSAPAQAERLPTVIENVLINFGIIPPRGAPQYCPEETSHLDATEAAVLLAQAEKAKSSYNKCASLKFLKEILRQHPGDPLAKVAHRDILMTLFQAQDFVGAINYANLNLDRDSEYTHYMMLRALGRQIQDLNVSPELMDFLSYSLGASLEQNDSNPYLKNLKYQNFLEKYPDSLYANEIRILQNEARQKYGSEILARARTNRLMMEYPKALNQLQMILEWGPVIDVFGEALYERIQLLSEFAFGLVRPRLISNVKLNKLLGRDLQTPVTQEERRKLASETFALAERDLVQMQTHLASSLWTQKAQEFLKSFQYE
ncbi:MAG: hypothetical protein ACK5Y2_05740 [Bdellovibrionales bacterium]